MKRLLPFWEDQHPLARNNMLILALAVIVWLLLALITYIAPRIMTLEQVIRFSVLERVWSITSFVLVVLLLLNALRISLRFLQRSIGLASVGMAWLSTLMVLFLTLNLPSFFEQAIGYVMDEPYSSVLEEYQALCDEWEATYGQQVTIALQPGNVDLGFFQDREEVNVTRIQKTIFFDFGTPEQRFGLACVLGGGSPPDSGRADDYMYTRIEKNYYEWIERTDR